MCDILVVTPSASKNKLMLFGKNSDRDPNEAQVVEIIPRTRHEEEYVKLTNMVYPQVKETYAVLISKPWWIYGAEMGVNEYGVVIGNVAVFTKEPYREKGMLGMDMLRLALERTRSAREALKFLIKLVEEVGQGGNYSYEKKFRYHNSFIIADRSEAWVLETAGIYWSAKRIRDFYTISNALTIRNDWDIAHDELVKHGVSKHGCSRDNFSFADCYSDKIYTRLAHGRERRTTTFKYLASKTGEITVWDIMSILRSHSLEPYNPAKGSMKDICMHYGGLLRPSQTASSMITMIKENRILNLITGTSNPCLSIYKPVILDIKLPFNLANTTNKYDPENYWWKQEKLHRKLQLCYTELAHSYREEIMKIEKKYLEETIYLFLKNSLTAEKITSILNEMYGEEVRIYNKWISMLMKTKCRAPIMYRFRIKRINRKAGIN